MRWEEEGRGGSGIDVVGSTYVCGSATIWMNSLINTILNHNHLHDRQRERQRESLREKVKWSESKCAFVRSPDYFEGTNLWQRAVRRRTRTDTPCCERAARDEGASEEGGA